MYTSADSNLYQGLKEVEEKYTSQLQKTSKTHCEIKSRMVSGDTVVDKVIIKESGKLTNEQIIVYKINGHKIISICFIK